MKYMEKEKQGSADWAPSGNGQPNAQSPASHSAAKTKGLYTMLGITMKSGRVYGISGKTGTGKTTAATQFLVEGAELGERGIMVLAGERGEEYVRNAKTFSFSFDKYYESGAIAVIDLSEEFWERKDALGSPTGQNDYIKSLSSSLGRYVNEHNTARMAIDGITTLLNGEEDLTTMLFSALKDAAPKCKILATSIVRDDWLSFYGVEEYKVDGLVRLDTGSDGTRTATIVKIRGAGYDPKPFEYAITSAGIVPLEKRNFDYLRKLPTK